MIRLNSQPEHSQPKEDRMSYGDHITRNRGATRFLLFALGIPQVLIGFWALLAPRSFYDDFPAGTNGWVNPLGPFDEHLVTDVGALFVALGFLLSFAAVSLRRGTVIASAIAWLIFSVPHFLWHVFNLEPYGTADAAGNTAALAWTVLGGALVLWLARPQRPQRPKQMGPAAATPADGQTRIEGVPDERAGLMARSAYFYSRRAVGKVMEPTRVFAHHPTVMAGYGALEYATEKADRVPNELKRLASTKAAALSGCEFCIDISSSLASEGGVSEAQLRALPEHSTSSEFTEVEKLVLDLAVGMTRTPVDVPEELFARLREHFDEAQLVELANEIALENYRARFNWAFGIGSQGFVGEGAFCVRAENVAS
jgi:alkylhydroperoxidase family enzyme